MAPKNKGKEKGPSKEPSAVNPAPARRDGDKLHDISGKIDETDEMKLRMLAHLGKPDSEDALYPPELNAHLIDQIKILTGESNELRKVLFEKDTHIAELNKTVADLNTRIRDILSGTGPTISSKSAGIISAKITELCKQNRHLVAEVEGYKTKNAALERKIMELDAMKKNENIDVCLCKTEPFETPSPDDIKELNMKLASVNKRLIDSKKKNIELKNEIITATKVLQHELGDKFTSLKELQNHVMGWKGRAEKIVLLQARIKELEEMLNVNKTVAEKKADVGNHIREIEAKRKQEIDQVMKDYKVIKDENENLKRKLDGAKCRIRNLECDSTTIRQKMQTFIDKSNADDQLINEQRNQIKTLEIYYQEILKENTIKMNKMHNEICEFQKCSKNTDAKVDALRKQATEKSTKIEELRAQLLRYEECSLQSVFFTPMRTATDNEIKKLSKLIVDLNARLDTERNSYEKLDVTTGGKKRTSIGGTEVKTSESTTLESEHEPVENLDKEELKYRLELTEEKLKIMEDKLRMVEEEKQEDYNNLMDMIQNSKGLFNEALKVLQKEKCVCNFTASDETKEEEPL
ncbi:coiled-coil domain-containing protein 13 [Phthorimaea operculella]|nr:coiled-coil domain-containing protein 13 [Phthorimaea operculella]